MRTAKKNANDGNLLVKITHRILVATSCSRSARSFFALFDQYMIGIEATAADADS